MNLGIDFGTTNSSIAYQRSPRELPVCASVDRASGIPHDAVLRTAVLLDHRGEVQADGVGAVALDPANLNRGSGSRLLRNLKPYLGTFRLREIWPATTTAFDGTYDYIRQEPGYSKFTASVELGELECSRDELIRASAAVVALLIGAVPAEFRSVAKNVVLGVPLTFPDFAKKRLLEIVRRSDALGDRILYGDLLARCRFLPEPIGASLLYAGECAPPRGKDSGQVLVLDSGGGTLDLALLEFATTGGQYLPRRRLALKAKVLAGRRYDELVQRRFLDRYRDALVRAEGEEVAGWRLERAAESIKIALSSQDIVVDRSLAFAGISVTVSRRDFEDTVEPLLAETEELVRETVSTLEDVSTVIMTGGSSLIPAVQARIRRLFPHASVIAEDPSETGRGEGVERALTAVSRGLALYDDLVRAQGITPFAYGFWDQVTSKSIVAAAKWSEHDAPRPTVVVPAADNGTATTLTLVQELVEPERVLNILNVPTLADDDGARFVRAQIETADDLLYPRVRIFSSAHGSDCSVLDVHTLPEATLARLIEHDDHVVRWGASAGPAGADTPYPEIVTLRCGDPVEFWQYSTDRKLVRYQGKIEKLHRILDGLPYAEATHWDLRRWRFYIVLEENMRLTFTPAEVAHIRLLRREATGRLRSRLSF